jgi:hypothetical protein
VAHRAFVPARIRRRIIRTRSPSSSTKAGTALFASAPCDDLSVASDVGEFGKRRDRAVERARQQLTSHHTARFSSVFAYGAVDIDPQHLVVWVMLADDPDEVPVWYFPEPDQAGPAQYGAQLLAEIDSMRSVVVDCFSVEGWPDANRIRVGFDSAVRVDAEGGWRYFK